MKTQKKKNGVMYTKTSDLSAFISIKGGIGFELNTNKSACNNTGDCTKSTNDFACTNPGTCIN